MVSKNNIYTKMNTFQANDWLSNRNQIFLNNNLFEKGSLINKISFRFSTKFKREQTQKIIEFVTLKLNTTHGAERNLYLDLGERYINHLKKDKKVIGYAILTSRDSTTWYLSQIAVHLQYKRQGHGKNLMNHIFTQARASYIHSIDLDMDLEKPGLY